MRAPFLLSALLIASGTFAQVDTIAVRYAATITQEDLRSHLSVLASDAYEGRETGMKGQKMAAVYIEDRFKEFGIPPVPGAEAAHMLNSGYQQQFPLVLDRPGSISFSGGNVPWAFGKDYFYISEELERPLKVEDVMVITPLSLGGAKLGGGSKVVLVLEPTAKENIASGRKDLRGRIKEVSSALSKTGTEVVLLVDQGATTFMQEHGRALSMSRMKLGTTAPAARTDSEVQVMVITPEVARSILDKARLTMRKALSTATKRRLIIKSPMAFEPHPPEAGLTGENVLGYVEGSDKKGEVVVVSAHYDHIGIIDGEVYNGADDDGSGTSAVIEMAQAFALAKAQGHGPRRSLLFMTVSGEEKGLFGSEWYTDHPVFPLDSTVADLNIDMIGRVDSAHADGDGYVYVIGSGRISSELKRINEAQNATYTKLELDYTFDSDSDPNRFYYRSDHYNFAKHGVPIAFYFNGVHADYHGPKDEVDRIRFDLLEQRARLVFHTAWELANREQRIRPDTREKLGED